MKRIEVTLHEQGQKGQRCLGISTEGHVILSTWDYSHKPGNAVTVDFFDMTTAELRDLKDKITAAIGGD